MSICFAMKTRHRAYLPIRSDVNLNELAAHSFVKKELGLLLEWTRWHSKQSVLDCFGRSLNSDEEIDILFQTLFRKYSSRQGDSLKQTSVVR